MGSLLCALASYLDARANQGTWYVRIEDLDPPREVAGADQRILDSLSAHHLHWDSPPVYQSQRAEAYQHALQQLKHLGQAYRCSCNRKRLAELNHNYDNACRSRSISDNTPAAIRFHTDAARQAIHLETSNICFQDEIQGESGEDFHHTGDFVIHRKDGLFAYQLAVVVDDIAQGITHIVRGSDLLDTTAKQILLTLTFGHPPPIYRHIPVLTYDTGLKLSKQNHAQAIDDTSASHNLLRCLRYLNQSPPETLKNADCSSILEWAIEHWNLPLVPRCLSIPQ